MKIRIIILYTILLLPIKRYSQDENIETKFGISISNLGVQNFLISNNSDRFLQSEEEFYGRSGYGDGFSISFLYFLSDKNSIVLRAYNANSYNKTKEEPIFDSVFGFGTYLGHYSIYRPDIELINRYSPFGNSFYIGPLLGSTGPRNAEYSKLFQINPLGIDFPRGFSYNSSSRIYGGMDTGFMIKLGDLFFFNIGYNIKLASSPRISQNLEMNYFIFNYTTIEEIFIEKLLIDNLKSDLDTIKDGSQAFYIEIGIKF